MIPAKIISIDDKVMVEWPPKPDYYDFLNKTYREALAEWELKKTIAEVENAYQGKITKKWFAEIITHFEDDKLWGVKIEKLSLNQTVFIEPTENNKCKIIKI